jgi:hypothetical protein
MPKVALLLIAGLMVTACAPSSEEPLGLAEVTESSSAGADSPNSTAPLTDEPQTDAPIAEAQIGEPEIDVLASAPQECDPQPLADCSGLDLRGRVFNRLDLYRVNFSGANLEGASFVGTRLTEANFSDANLARANFSSGVLARANLQGASVRATNFRGASLVRANLKDVRHFVGLPLGEEWWGVDFSDAIWPDGRRCRPAARGYCSLTQMRSS